MPTDTASTKPNSRKSRPAVPGRKAMGTKTATSTAVVATTAKNTWRVPSTAAAAAPKPWRRRRCTFSRTTIASSTISPVARTRASRVRMLIENPRAQMQARVPSKATGMARAGTRVRAMEPEKRRMVSTTTPMARRRLFTTSVTAPRMKVDSSEILMNSTPSKRSWRRRMA